MRFETVHAAVGHVPYINATAARHLYDLIGRHDCRRVLELGIAHGTSTCYIAAALASLLDDTGNVAEQPMVTAVDLIDVNFSPTAEQQLEQTGLSSYAEVIRMRSGYNWFLHDQIAAQTSNDLCTPLYDLCIIDGPKNWTIDSSAFFLVDKLLRPGGWIIFDDYHWTYSHASKKRDSTDGVTHRELSTAEMTIPHIAEVFELLVKQHSNYTDFVRWEDMNWAMARKRTEDEQPGGPPFQKRYTVRYDKTVADPISRWFSQLSKRYRTKRHRRRAESEDR